MDKQSIVNDIAPRILAQGPSVQFIQAEGHTVFNGCKYRLKMEDGSVRMCAAGMAIKDEYYHPSLEGMPVRNERVQHALAMSKVPMDLMNFLQDMQGAHDEAIYDGKSHHETFGDRYKERVRDLCRKHEIVSPL